MRQYAKDHEDLRLPKIKFEGHHVCIIACVYVQYVLSLHSRISNNLNQYAKKANETGNIYREDIAELKEMHAEQTKLLRKTLKSVIHLYDVDLRKRN